MASPGDDLTKMFKKPLPKNPTLIESLSPAYHIRPPAPSVTQPVEVLGEELSYFTKNPEQPHANPPPQASSDQSTHDDSNKKGGIGEDHPHGLVPKILKKSRSFPPPPISSIGKSGKPCVYLKAYRKDGMLVLREVRSPWQKFLQTTREDGRLRMHLIHADDEEDVTGGRDDDDDGQEEGQEVQEQERQEELQDGSKCREEEEDEKKRTGNDDSDSHQTQQTHV